MGKCTKSIIMIGRADELNKLNAGHAESIIMMVASTD